VLTTFSIGRFLNVRAVYWPLSIGALILLSYLGFMCLRSAWKGGALPSLDSTGPATGEHRSSLRRNYATGLLMTLLNPMTLAFWFVALPGIAGQLQQSALPLISAGVFIGTISWVISFSGTLSLLGRFRRGLWMRFADAFGGVTLLGFAGAVLWRAVGGIHF
jgi:threonine/homoserine/homoserine lactone efflux protein